MPSQIQLLYSKLKQLKVDKQFIDPVFYSFNSKNCLLNKQFKRTIYKDSNSLFRFELWPANSYQIESLENDESIQLIQIVHGSFLFEWYNQNEDDRIIHTELGVKNDIVWSTLDYYSDFKMTNKNANKFSLVIRAIYYFNQSNFNLKNTVTKNINNLEQILSRVKLEYDQKSCKISLHKNNKKCDFLNQKCGYSLNYLFDPNIEDDSLYECKNFELSLVEDCRLYNKTCVSDEKCVAIGKHIAFAKINAAYEKFNNETNLFPDGSILFEQSDEDSLVSISGQIKGLRPNSFHAIHIHEFNDLGNNCRDTG